MTLGDFLHVERLYILYVQNQCVLNGNKSHKYDVFNISCFCLTALRW